MVEYEVRSRAAWITLASPATRNALSSAMIEGLGAALAPCHRRSCAFAWSCSPDAGRRSAPGRT